jgi:hypothetical protein
MFVFQGRPPWVSPTGWISSVSLFGSVDSEKIGHLKTPGSADVPTKCSRLQELLRAAERAISCRGALLNLSGRPQRVALVKADEPQFSLCSPAPTLTSFPRAGADTFLPPVFRGGKGSSLQSPFYAEICPAFGRATLALYVVTKTLGQPYLSRPTRFTHGKPA